MANIPSIVSRMKRYLEMKHKLSLPNILEMSKLIQIPVFDLNLELKKKISEYESHEIPVSIVSFVRNEQVYIDLNYFFKKDFSQLNENDLDLLFSLNEQKIYSNYSQIFVNWLQFQSRKNSFKVNLSFTQLLRVFRIIDNQSKLFNRMNNIKIQLIYAITKHMKSYPNFMNLNMDSNILYTILCSKYNDNRSLKREILPLMSLSIIETLKEMNDSQTLGEKIKSQNNLEKIIKILCYNNNPPSNQVLENLKIMDKYKVIAFLKAFDVSKSEVFSKSIRYFIFTLIKEITYSKNFKALTFNEKIFFYEFTVRINYETNPKLIEFEKSLEI